MQTLNSSPSPVRNLPVPLLTMTELCEYLNMPERTLRRHLKSDDRPPARKIGGQYRSKLVEIDAWLDELARKQAS